MGEIQRRDSKTAEHIHEALRMKTAFGHAARSTSCAYARYLAAWRWRRWPGGTIAAKHYVGDQ